MIIYKRFTLTGESFFNGYPLFRYLNNQYCKSLYGICGIYQTTYDFRLLEIGSQIYPVVTP